MRRTLSALFVLSLLAGLLAPTAQAAPAAPLDATYQALPFAQDWTDTSLITTSDSWSGVPGIDGYRGDGLASTGGDPQAVLAGDDTAPVLDVNANQASPNTNTTGGVTEFHLADPVVALQGSGTADAPYLRLYLDTTGFQAIQVRYNVRDIDGAADNAVQQVALHYRVGGSGNFTNVPAAYIPDATTGPSLATLVTPINITLPAAVDNQAQVQLRIMTVDASGSDEWVGIDDITVTGTPIAADTAPTVTGSDPLDGATGVPVGSSLQVTFSEAVNVAAGWYGISCATSGAHTATVSGGPTVWTLDPDTDFAPGETCTVTVYAAFVTDQDADDPPDAMVADASWSFTTATAASGCTELFFSEYIEGSSFNKALEIFNGRTTAVDLAGYTVELYSNGAAAPSQSVGLTGSVAAGDVFVLAHGSAGAAILAQADLLNSAVVNFNGDDAVALRYNGTLIDVIGQIGVDPGTEWGAGLTSTADNTLRRKSTIAAGDADGSDAFDPALEWDGYAVDTFAGLGAHTAACTPPVEVAPSVVGRVPGAGATGVALASAIQVTFSEPVNVAAGWYGISCTTSGAHTAVVSGGPTVWTLDPDTDFVAGESCTVTVYAAFVTDQDANDPPDVMVADDSWSFSTLAAGFTKIHAIQGSGATAASGTFSVEAIVVGDYQGATGVDDYKLDGFFIQEEDLDADADPATSEGLFVYCQTCPTDVAVGDKVQVTGAASEYFGMSQLNATAAGAVVVVSSGHALPTPAVLTLPVPGVTATDLAGATAQINAYYEAREGMLVQAPGALSVTEYFELFRYGQLVLAQGGRFRQYTDVAAPAVAGYTAHQIDLARRTVILDDDSNQQNHALMENPDIPVYHPLPGYSTTNYVRGGDTIANLTGVLHWSFAGLTGTDAWRIRPVAGAFPYAFTPGNPRPAAPAPAGNLRVASFNVLNYFTTLNARGADSAAELDRQATKIVAAMQSLDADVLGLMEIENNNDAALNDLVGRLNAAAGAGTYAAIPTGTVGTDEITVALIYRPARVTPVGAAAVLADPAFTDPNGTGTQKSRPAIAQTFEEHVWGERFTVVVNHLKSKGSCPASGVDADQGDGQGCWNDTRAKGAGYLVNTWLPVDPTGAGDPDVVILGDLNSYRREDPITAITAAGYTDLLDRDLGAAAYGYVFDGQLGYLDHALASPGLAPQVTAVAHWHINADEVNLLDYNDTIKDGAAEQDFEAKPTATELYEPNAYRSSDHDPVLAGLGLYPDLSDAAAYGQAWHTGQGVWRLGPDWTGEASVADGADADDGVTRDPADSWNDGHGEVYVTVSGPGQSACLNAWLDYSAGSPAEGVVDAPDGDFDANEHVIANVVLPPGAGQLVTFSLESGVINGTATYPMRFRLTPICPTGPQPTGRADGGEVEDYAFHPGPLAVTLAAFTAGADPAAGGIRLAWETVSEIDHAGFHVYRAPAAAGPWDRLTAKLLPAAAPGMTGGAAYAWTDATAEAGQVYYYLLEDLALDGTATRHGPVSAVLAAPNAVGLAGFAAAPAGGAGLPWAVGLALAAGLAIWRRRRA